jgi:MarR family transcriptional regulator, transcriptional regulator for hemolysin
VYYFSVHTNLPPNQSLGYLLADNLRLIRRDFRQRNVDLGLTPALARLLYYVHRQPGSRQTDLAVLLDVSAVTLGRMLDRLALGHFIRREQDPADRRATRIYIDGPGEPVVNQLASMGLMTQNQAMQGFTDAERDQLFALLIRVQNNLRHER